MEYLRLAVGMLIMIFIFMFIIRIFMKIANHIGETLGIGKFIIGLYERVSGNDILSK
ncbi:hypothetical protein [Sporosalibacterium faouarense]|uniref:hypothetical protein n=1 Tax=Sporosalibacterium faouarense TaxID=516123 RepID=UPI00192AE29E|nr:hypothetical protein [Sporosalibacterium faouarense]